MLLGSICHAPTAMVMFVSPLLAMFAMALSAPVSPFRGLSQSECVVIHESSLMVAFQIDLMLKWFVIWRIRFRVKFIAKGAKEEKLVVVAFEDVLLKFINKTCQQVYDEWKEVNHY